MFARIAAAREKEEGFTLIELLVVIIIIGILAAIAIPVFLNQRASAAKASLTSDARNGAIAIETYFTDNQAYPANTAAVTALNPSLSANNAVTDLSLTRGHRLHVLRRGHGRCALAGRSRYDSAS